MTELGSGAAVPLIAVTALPGDAGGLACAAAFAGAVARRDAGVPGRVVLVEVASGVRRRPTLISAAAARALEVELRGTMPAAARGTVCWVVADPDGAWQDDVALCRDAGPDAVIVHAAPEAWRDLIDSGTCDGAVLRADTGAKRPLAALSASDLIATGVRVGIVPRPPGVVATRRALAGIEPGGELGVRASRLARRLLASQGGQALPAVLGIAMAIALAGLLVAILGAAASGGVRMQRAADLAAVSAARSLRDDHHRLFEPERLPGGAANPAHLDESEYRARALDAAGQAARRNGAGEARLGVSFPIGGFAPTRVRVELTGAPVVGSEATAGEVEVAATAEAYPVTGGQPGAGATEMASGGGYSGPLIFRQGEGMRPDVARAFDRMARAAATAGHALIVNSGFRSDAEQAVLFAANPDPRMVARPGTSLHRCATELDLGPPAAYAWLAANAPRHGFLLRYSWEPWHFGFVAGPDPCSRTGDAVGRGRASPPGGDGARSASTLPGFVPPRYRTMIARAASRQNVSAALLAAQLMAESGFNPFAVSPAGARGIAQFMPATAAAYGLRDPLDPAASIAAQARLMADLLSRYDGRTELALAAYNAGPVPVDACDCIPPYSETQAYVARILGLLGGGAAAPSPALEVRLVR